MGCGGARVGQMPSSMTFIALVVGAVGGCLNLFSLVYFFFFFFFFIPLWETARNRLKYCLIGPLNPK